VAAIALGLVAAGTGTAEAQLLSPQCNPASIAGTARDGETLTASRGSCSGAPSPTVRLQWFRCDANEQSCVARTSQVQASSLAYTAKPADVNGRLVIQQTAENTFGEDLDNTATAVVAAIPPSATPVISGISQVGEQLRGSAGFLSGTSPSVVGRQWLRCEANGAPCTPIPGATGERYTVTADDVGKTLRFQVTVQGPQHSVNVHSAPTSTVPAPPGAGQPDPGTPGQPAPPPPAAPPALQLLDPFPSVVIAGRVFPTGAVVSMLLVRGPRGAQVGVTCRGRRCPRRRLLRTIRGGSVRLRPFETRLAPGIVLQIRVTKGRRIGKFARLRIRSDRPPGRTDLCLAPGKRRPVSCPAGVG
jgi:hypothetical protein